MTTALVSDSSQRVVTFERRNGTWLAETYDGFGNVVWSKTLAAVLGPESERRIPGGPMLTLKCDSNPLIFDFEGEHYLDEEAGQLVLVFALDSDGFLGEVIERRLWLLDGERSVER